MRSAFLSALFIAAIGAATAADPAFPKRPIRLIVGYPPGGATDIAARLVGQKLAPVLGQSVVVDNRAGASGTIAATIVASADPDGHTLSFAASPEAAIYRALMKNPPYDSLKDFQPVSLVGRVPYMLVGNTPAEFRAFIESETMRWLKVAQNAGVKPDRNERCDSPQRTQRCAEERNPRAQAGSAISSVLLRVLDDAVPRITTREF